MSDRSEVVVTSDASGSVWTACIWDSHTGTSLMNYKGGGAISAHCMALVGNDYLLSAEKSKPLIHVWPLNSREVCSKMDRIVTPGCVSALCISPNSDYCIIGVAEKIYIWDLVAGQLLPVTTRHFRSISCIKFTDDGSHFISCGQDGMIIVWPLAYLIASSASEFLQQAEIGQQEPKYTFSDHSLPVTDMYVGHGGIQALLASVSGDHSCKIYNLSDGALLLSVVFNCALSAITMSCNELDIFVGAVNGSIFHFNMQHFPRTPNHHVQSKDESLKYIGHSKTISSLSTSLDGLRLVSGSADEKVIIWDIKSKQCLKVLQHKGPVTNAFFTVCPKHVFTGVFNPSSFVTNFKKVSGETKNVIRVIKRDAHEDDARYTNTLMKTLIPKDTSLSQDDLEEKVRLLKEVNKKLFLYSVNKIVNNI